MCVLSSVPHPWLLGMKMRAESFLGQVLAVVSRRASAFVPLSNEPSTFPGIICSVIPRRAAAVPASRDLKSPDAPTTPITEVTVSDVGAKVGPRSTARTPEREPLLTPAQVAVMFRVDPKTVTRWAKTGRLTSIRTLGGHRRYRETEVRALLEGIKQRRHE